MLQRQLVTQRVVRPMQTATRRLLCTSRSSTTDFNLSLLDNDLRRLEVSLSNYRLDLARRTIELHNKLEYLESRPDKSKKTLALINAVRKEKQSLAEEGCQRVKKLKEDIEVKEKQKQVLQTNCYESDRAEV